MQPVWRDDIGFRNRTGEQQDIVLSAFTVMHRKNSDDAGSYERLILTGTLNVIDEVNEQVFKDENIASEEQVCLQCIMLRVCALCDASWAAWFCVQWHSWRPHVVTDFQLTNGHHRILSLPDFMCLGLRNHVECGCLPAQQQANVSRKH